MNAGVSTVPRGKDRRPRRAAPSVAWSWNCSRDMERWGPAGPRIVADRWRIRAAGPEKRPAWPLQPPSARLLPCPVRPPQQHRVAVGEEAVALRHRVAVGLEHP